MNLEINTIATITPITIAPVFEKIELKTKLTNDPILIFNLSYKIYK